MARGHTKSRFGCRECKQRHIKCDESKPSCVNCVTVKRACSFLSQASTTPATLPGRPSVYTNRSPTTSQSPHQIPLQEQRHDEPSPQTQAQRQLHFEDDPASIPTLTNPPTSQYIQSSRSPPISSPPDLNASPPSHVLPSLPDEHFTITHLSLLHHYSHTLCPILLSQNPKAEPMLAILLQEAFTAPFLMDQILGIAAAHKSTLSSSPGGEAVADWFVEATELQDRSLRKFHAEMDAGRRGSRENESVGLVTRRPLAVLGFSMLVSHSALFFVCATATRLWKQEHGEGQNSQVDQRGSSVESRRGNMRTAKLTFAAVLDELNTCLVVHQGMADVTRQALPFVDPEARRKMFAFAEGKTDLMNGRVGRVAGDAVEVVGGMLERGRETVRGDDVGGYPSPSESSVSGLSGMDIDGGDIGSSSADDEHHLEQLPPVDSLRELFPGPAPPQPFPTSMPTMTSSIHSQGTTSHAEIYHKTLTALLTEYHDASIASPINLSTPKAQRYLSATQHFLVRVPPGYRDLVAQRRPEALVLLAYYAVLIHRGGENWVIGSVVGRCLVQGVVEYLGGVDGHWGRWMMWCVRHI